MPWPRGASRRVGVIAWLALAVMVLSGLVTLMVVASSGSSVALYAIAPEIVAGGVMARVLVGRVG